MPVKIEYSWKYAFVSARLGGFKQGLNINTAV